MGEPMTLTEIRAEARRSRAEVVATVIFANDAIALVKAGPRGGWRVVKNNNVPSLSLLRIRSRRGI